MSTLGFVNVTLWDIDQVCSWIRGLENSAAQYAEVFQEAGINGKQLLSLDYRVLEKNLNIWKIGHQELILHSIQLLEAVNRELEHDTLSVIALRLDCHAKNLCNLLRSQPIVKSKKPEPSSGRALLLEVMCGVSDIVETVKCILPWLDRVPFDDCEFFNDLRNRILDYTFELLAHSKDDDSQDKILDSCYSISSVCEDIITNSKDPLVIQTASLELVTLRRNSDEALGMSIMSSYDNVHTIGHINAGSTADVSKKIDVGDEIVQVNYQTVIGWELKKLLMTFSDTKKDLTLTLKKKPRHLTLSGYQKKRAPKKQLPSGAFQTQFSPKAANARARSRRRIKHIMAATSASIPEQDTDDNISDSEVFNSGVEFKEPISNEEKARRATVSGASPVLPRRVVGSTENISSLRPKSYFPVSTNIPILPMVLQMKNLTSKKLPFMEQNESNSSAPAVSGPQSPASSGGSPRKGSSGSASEVAGTEEADRAPRLLRLVKLDSNARTELTEQKKRNESISSLDSILSSSSYGSQGNQLSNLKHQKPHFRSERDLASASPSGLLRKNFLRRTGLNRRISCKDLGGGDCQGWLWKKKEGTGLVSSRWTKCWFVLKNKDLYYYNDPEPAELVPCFKKSVQAHRTLVSHIKLPDLKALGVIHLPGFTISPSQESRSKKYAFKGYNNSGVIFFFAAERQDDMAKWMNKIGLASLANLDTSHFPTTAGFRRPGKESDHHLADFSESDEDENKSMKESTSSSPAGSREDLIGLYRHIRAADLDLSGTDVKARRSTILGAASIDKESAKKNEEICRLLSLKRTLKDKEQLLVILEELLKKSPISAIDLIHFKVMQPSVVEELFKNRKEGKLGGNTEEEENEAKEGGSSGGSDVEILESLV